MAQVNDKRVKLDLLHGFGSSTCKGYRDSVGILEEEGNKKILYPIAKYIGVKQLDQPEMNFIKLSDNLEQIQCMAISKTKKFVAICEKHKDDSNDGRRKCPSVSVYNIKASLQKTGQGTEKQHFPYAETTVKNYSALAFSSDDHSRFLLCLTEPPENKLVYIDVVKGDTNHASCAINTNIDRISISPVDNHLVAISGPNCFKILRVQESSFVYMAESIKGLSQNQNFTDHCWFDNNHRSSSQRVALANDQGEIFTIFNNEVEQHINCGLEKIGVPITTIQSFSKGLIVGGEEGNFSIWIKDENPMKLYDRRSDEEKYDLLQLKCWRSERPEAVTCIDISQNDDLMVAAFANNDIATYDLQKLIPNVLENLEQMKRNLKNLEKRVNFQYIFKGSHHGPVTAMDICLQRPLLVTCSNYDSTIRIWNYVNYRCELVRKFDVKEGTDQPTKTVLSVAFHPSGFYLAAGFIDKLRIFHILHDKFRVFAEIQLKNATYLRFSNGGQYLAAAAPKQQSQKTSQYQIFIYNSFTLEQVADLKGHLNRVTEMLWGPKDDFLLSCGVDGLAYEWNTTKWTKKDRQILQQNTQLSSIMYNQSSGLTVVSGGEANQGLIQEFKYKDESQPQTQDQDYWSSMPIHNFRITKLQFLTSYFNQTGIIAGTNLGSVKVWSSNFHLNKGLPFETISCHDGEITQMRVSPNGRYVFTAGNDGIVFIFQVTELNNGEVISAKNNQKQMAEQINPKSLCVDDSLAEIVLVPKIDIEYYIKEREKIKNEYEDYQQRKLEEMEDFKRKQEKMIQDLEEQKQKEIQKLTNDYNKLQASKEQLQKESEMFLEIKEDTHLEQVRELDKLYEAKLAFENEKYLQLEQELSESKSNFSKQIKEIEQKNDKTLMLLKSEFIEQFSKVNKVYSSTKDTAIDIKKTYEERLSQLEEEHELEINVMINKYEQNEDVKNKEISAEQKRASDLDKEKQAAKKKKEELEKIVKEKDEIIAMLDKQVENLQKDLQQERKDKKNKEEIVKEKDKSINNLKYKISDLQKTKHVLSFRTTEMRKSLEPKEAQIEKLKEELFKLEHEFQSILKNYQLQNDKMKKLENQIETLNNNLKQEQNLKKKTENEHFKMLMQIHNIVKTNDQKQYINGMNDLYHEYVEKLGLHNNKQDPKSVDEMGRMIGQLEKSIFQINKSTGKVITRRETEIHKKTKENAELIYDLNGIRKENKEQKAEISNLRRQKETANKEKKAFLDEINKLNKLVQKQKKLTYSASQADNLNQPQDLFTGPGLTSSLDYFQASKPTINQRGKILKGSNFDLKTLGTFDKAKMMDLMAEVELVTQKRIQAEDQLQTFKKNVREHLHQFGCQDRDLQNQITGIADQIGDTSAQIRLPQIQQQSQQLQEEQEPNVQEN